MGTYYRTYDDFSGKLTTDLESILYYQLSARSNEALMEIVSDYRGVYDERSIHKTKDLNEVLYDLRASEVLKACENFDVDCPYFEYDGKTVTGIDSVYDYLTYNEIKGLIEWLMKEDRWEDYPELYGTICKVETDCDHVSCDMIDKLFK